MTKKPYIITHSDSEGFEIWTNFRLACEKHGWDYEAWRKEQGRRQQRKEPRWPLEIDRFTIRPVLVNEINIEAMPNVTSDTPPKNDMDAKRTPTPEEIQALNEAIKNDAAIKQLLDKGHDLQKKLIPKIVLHPSKNSFGVVFDPDYEEVFEEIGILINQRIDTIKEHYLR